MTPQEAAPAPAATELSDEAYLERRVIFLFAGNAGAKRALRGGAPGWRRPRTRESLAAHHESGHAIVASFLRFHVAGVDIKTRTLPGGKKVISGIARIVNTPAQAEGLPELSDAEVPDGDSDLHGAVKICAALALERDWRSILRTARRLRREAERLVDMHWDEIVHVAESLLLHKTLPAGEIKRLQDRFLGPPVPPSGIGSGEGERT